MPNAIGASLDLAIARLGTLRGSAVLHRDFSGKVGPLREDDLLALRRFALTLASDVDSVMEEIAKVAELGYEREVWKTIYDDLAVELNLLAQSCEAAGGDRQ